MMQIMRAQIQPKQNQHSIPMINNQQGGNNPGQLAEEVINLLNNAFTQINQNLSKGIEKKI